MCINSRRRSCNGFLSFGYGGCWIVNKPTTIEDESDRIDPNKANIFPKRSTEDILVILI
jgi:hypothetical protein